MTAAKISRADYLNADVAQRKAATAMIAALKVMVAKYHPMGDCAEMDTAIAALKQAEMARDMIANLRAGTTQQVSDGLSVLAAALDKASNS
jgi:hypothetical protein